MVSFSTETVHIYGEILVLMSLYGHMGCFMWVVKVLNAVCPTASVTFSIGWLSHSAVLSDSLCFRHLGVQKHLSSRWPACRSQFKLCLLCSQHWETPEEHAVNPTKWLMIIMIMPHRMPLYIWFLYILQLVKSKQMLNYASFLVAPCGSLEDILWALVLTHFTFSL